MFFNQICQANCQRQDRTFESLPKTMSASKAKFIEIMTKTMELIAMICFLLTECMTWIFDIKNNPHKICEDKLMIGYTCYVVRLSVVSTCSMLYLCRVVCKLFSMIKLNFNRQDIKSLLNKEIAFRFAISIFLWFAGAFGMAINNLNNGVLTTLYSFEIGIGLLAFWWSYFIFIHEIISQTNVDASVNFTNDNENPDVTIRIHNSNRQIEAVPSQQEQHETTPLNQQQRACLLIMKLTEDEKPLRQLEEQIHQNDSLSNQQTIFKHRHTLNSSLVFYSNDKQNSLSSP